MPSFDVVSVPDWNEIKNALNQAQKELSQRYDFKGTDVSIEIQGKSLLASATSDDRVRAAWDLLMGKLANRNVSLKHFHTERMLPGAGGGMKMTITVQEGLATDKAKDIVKRIKESGLKVQGSITGDTVRVSGKKKDDLQGAISFLRQQTDLEVALAFENFRD
jgi:cyclic-di-GMP-binding protein